MSFGKIDQPSKVHHGLGPQKRIAYHGELSALFRDALRVYGLGSVVSFEPKQNGYEDFNVKLSTSSGLVFAKCFAQWRSADNCVRYLQMIEAAYQNGVRTPKIYHNRDNVPMTTVATGGETTNLCLMEYLDGGNVWESGRPLSRPEQAEVIRQAALINKSSYRPDHIHDSWAIPNLAENYDRNKERIPADDRGIIEALLSELNQVDIPKLPHAFVHGDIRTTNVMRHHDGQVYVIDFSVANYYPRIVELAVLASDILFDPNDPATFADTYVWMLDEYREAGIELEPYEKAALPLFVKLAHAANVIGASSVDATNYISQAENNHWLRLGQQGLPENSH